MTKIIDFQSNLQEFLKFFVLKLDFRAIFPSNEASGSFQKLPEASGSFRKVPEASKMEASGSFRSELCIRLSSPGTRWVVR